MAASRDEFVLARTTVAKVDEVNKALDELLLIAQPDRTTYTNEDLADYISSIRSMMSFALMLVPNAGEVRMMQHERGEIA